MPRHRNSRRRAPARRAGATALLAAIALLVLWASPQRGARAAGGTALGRLERESVDEALEQIGIALDPAPAGKTIGRIHVVSQKVFSRRDWLFQLLNVFHRTTRSWAIERELLIKPGQPYDEARIEESIRHLQAPPSMVVGSRSFTPPELSSAVAVVPVASGRPGIVDLLVVTRDVWSLRFNTVFEFQQDTLAYLATSLSENNLFGWRKYLSLGFIMDQGAMGFGPTYFDPNIRGTRLTLLASAMAWYTRAAGSYEGNSETFSLRYPLFSLDSRWGAGVDVVHQDAVVRNFRGNDLRLVDLASTPGLPRLPGLGESARVPGIAPVSDRLPYAYRRKIVTLDGSVVRSFRSAGGGLIQRLTVGYRVDARRSDVLPDFPGDEVTAQLFLNEYAPLTERRSEPYARYDLFTPRYAVFRDLDTFDLRENRRLGPTLAVVVSQGLPALGADRGALGLSGLASWAEAPAGFFAQVQVQASARVRDRPGLGGNELIDQNVKADLFVATPIGRVGRLVFAAAFDAVRADTLRTRFFLGGRTGLRGYAIGDFAGTTQAVGHVELRTRPVALVSQRVGALLFYDVGDAAASPRALVAHHDFGVGLRWLIPQLNSSVLRFDWAFASHDTAFTRAGFPGRLTAGYQQVF